MDAVRTAVMNNRFNAIVEEASAAIYRTAHTTFVKIVQDYQCAIATAEGEMFAYPMLSGVNVFVGSPLKPTLDAIGRENLKPGDIIITNDPFATDGLVTHLMDVTLLYPIFFDEKLIAIGWAFVHASDIGGAVPGSISPAFTEVFQEGLRVRPMKLYEGGVLNEAIKSIFQDNSRIPTELWGDIQAMISGLKSMDRRVSELCERYDRESVEEGMQDVINYAETKARAVIRTIRDGVYTFSDYLEGIHDGQLAYFSVTMTVKDSEIEVDFTGTDPRPTRCNSRRCRRCNSRLGARISGRRSPRMSGRSARRPRRAFPWRTSTPQRRASAAQPRRYHPSSMSAAQP
ncbi:hydantoinase B/oxoprolinase family protein [Agrobacterium fabrum]|uniref:hydantoinase B/oxoprolinase family protein n=1 Tax=Agrobacterium fabrum TaxID=1176649 RepID=UPI00061FABB7|nr:hydantoin utilization protein B [Agrobacterium tumefaciens]